MKNFSALVFNYSFVRKAFKLRLFLLPIGYWLLPSFYLAIGYCLLPSLASAQNLIYNPGFESDSAGIINDYSQLSAGGTLVNGWYVPTDGTSDYYNSHSSTIKGHPIPKARTGQGRVAMIWSNAWQNAYREFVTGRLIKPLEKNKKYKVSFYICRYKYAQWSPMQIGAYFTKDSMLQKNYYANIKVEPQMKVEDYTILEDRYYWHKVEGIILADGGEQYITLGNFKSTINDLSSPAIKVSNKFTIVATRSYAYCFIDDVSVEEYHEEVTPVAKKKLFLYLIDISSSMKNDDKYERLKNGIKKSIRNLPADAEFSIIGFSNDAKTILPPTKSILYDFADVLDTIKLSGGTDAAKAINFTYDFMNLQTDFDAELIMCTDGQFTLDNETFVRVMKGDNHFNLLQMGGGRNKRLDELVNSTGGKYVVAENKNIKEEIKTLSNSVSTDMTEVQYTKANKGKVLLKWTLLLSIIPLVILMT
jgi:uncharacterized protein YegL